MPNSSEREAPQLALGGKAEPQPPPLTVPLPPEPAPLPPEPDPLPELPLVEVPPPCWIGVGGGDGGTTRCAGAGAEVRVSGADTGAEETRRGAGNAVAAELTWNPLLCDERLLRALPAAAVRTGCCLAGRVMAGDVVPDRGNAGGSGRVKRPVTVGGCWTLLVGSVAAPARRGFGSVAVSALTMNATANTTTHALSTIMVVRWREDLGAWVPAKPRPCSIAAPPGWRPRTRQTPPNLPKPASMPEA